MIREINVKKSPETSKEMYRSKLYPVPGYGQSHEKRQEKKNPNLEQKY